MKLFTTVKLAAALCLALSILSASAAPMFGKPSPTTSSSERAPAADWWRTYLLMDSHKKPPTFPVIFKSRAEELPHHFSPFHERVTRLKQLKE